MILLTKNATSGSALNLNNKDEIMGISFVYWGFTIIGSFPDFFGTMTSDDFLQFVVTTHLST